MKNLCPNCGSNAFKAIIKKASAIQIGTVNFINPMAGKEIIEEMEAFLKEQGLIEIHSSGMIITEDGRVVIKKLKSFIHSIKGLAEIEEKVRKLLNLKKVIIRRHI